MPGADEAWTPPISLTARRRQRTAARTAAVVPPERLLHRAASAVQVARPLVETLGELADVALAASGAARCGVLLLDGARLVPTVSRIVAGTEGSASFRSLDPIELAAHPQCRALLADGRAVSVADARALDLVPASWLDQLDLRALVVVPVVSGRDPVGALALTYAEPHGEMSDGERDLLEAVAAHAALAVRAARLADTARRQAQVHEVVAAGVARLAEPAEPARVLADVAAGCAELLRADPCVVLLLDSRGRHATLVAAVGSGVCAHPGSAADVPDDLRALLAQPPGRAHWLPSDPWNGGFAQPAGRPAHYLLAPVGAAPRPRGLLLLGLAEADPDAYAAAIALANVGAAALDRAALARDMDRHDRRVRALDAVAELVAARPVTSDLTGALADLLAEDGVTVGALTLRDRQLARQLSWEALPGTRPAAPGVLAVPVRAGRRLVGHLHVRPADLPPAESAYVEAVARALGDAMVREVARDELDEAVLAREVAAERERLTADLHDTVGELFLALGLHAHRAADELPSGSPWADRVLRLADIAREGKWAIDHAARVLAHAPSTRRALPSALRGLAREIEADSGITIAVTVTGRAARLGTDVEHALYRVAQEALAHAWRRAGCSLVAVALDYSDREVALRVRDDGVGLELRADDTAVGIGVAGMRRAMAEVGGALRMTNASPRGVVVEARAGRGSR